MKNYAKILNYILTRIIEEKKRRKGNWESTISFSDNPSFAENLKNNTLTKYKIDDWEYEILLKKLMQDGYIEATQNPTYKGVIFSFFMGYVGEKIMNFSRTFYKLASSFVLLAVSILAVYIGWLQYNLQKNESQKLKEQIIIQVTGEANSKWDSIKSQLLILNKEMKMLKDSKSKSKKN